MGEAGRWPARPARTRPTTSTSGLSRVARLRGPVEVERRRRPAAAAPPPAAARRRPAPSAWRSKKRSSAGALSLGPIAVDDLGPEQPRGKQQAGERSRPRPARRPRRRSSAISLEESDICREQPGSRRATRTLAEEAEYRSHADLRNARRRPGAIRMRHFAVSVVGRDRPGIAAAVAEVLLGARGQHRGLADDDPARPLHDHADRLHAGAVDAERAAGRPRQRARARSSWSVVVNEVTEADPAAEPVPTHIV